MKKWFCKNMDKNKCPFGDALQKYWDRRYDLFSRFDEGVQIDAEGLYSATPEIIALHQARKMNCKIVVDGFCGVGANAIAFAMLGAKVYAIEKDEKRLRMAQYNAKIYGVEKKVKFICGNFFVEAPKIKAEGVFLDLEWGGPDYKSFKKLKLSDFEPDGKKVLETAFKYFKKIAFKAPNNFDFSELKKFGKPYEIEDNVMYGRVIFRTVYFL